MHFVHNRSKSRKEKESVDVLACIALLVSLSRVCSSHSVVVIDRFTLVDSRTLREALGRDGERGRKDTSGILQSKRERETREMRNRDNETSTEKR